MLDAADQTILQQLTELDTTESAPYQGFEKALVSRSHLAFVGFVA